MNNQRMKWDAEAAFKRIESDSKIYAQEPGQGERASRFLYGKRPHKAGWTPAPDPRAYMKAKPDVYKGRDYEALTKAALRKPVGYWEDAPRGPKFAQDSTCPKCGNMMVAGHYCSTGGAKFGGGAGKALTDADEHGVTRAKPAPSSDSDLYEPIGTMPVVGDECVKVSHIQIAVGEHIELDVGSRITITGPKRDSPFGEVFDHDRNISGIYAECFRRGSWRILKRPTKPRDDAECRKAMGLDTSRAGKDT